MGRRRSFDPAEAARAARAVFWREGFDGAAMPDLEEATGLNRSSIYHQFGSKRGLFDAAVDSYLDEVVRPRLRILVQEPIAPDAVHTYLEGLKAALLAYESPSSANGCLMVTTANSALAKDEAVRERIVAYRAELTAGFTSGLSHQPGFDPARIAPTAMAITSLVVAAMSITRVDPSAAAETIDAALALTAQEHATASAREGGSRP